MLKQYIFWGAFAAVVIGVVVTLIRRRQRSRRWRTGQPAVTPFPSSAGRPAMGAAATSTPRLMCLGGAHRGHRFAIPPKGLSIGRARDNDLVIVDGRISAHHAWIGIVGGKVMLLDYQSLTGTFLNADMNSPVSEVTLADGDTIIFGGHDDEQFSLVVE